MTPDAAQLGASMADGSLEVGLLYWECLMCPWSAASVQP